MDIVGAMELGGTMSESVSCSSSKTTGCLLRRGGGGRTVISVDGGELSAGSRSGEIEWRGNLGEIGIGVVAVMGDIFRKFASCIGIVIGVIDSVGVMFRKLRSLAKGVMGWPSETSDIRIAGLVIGARCAGDVTDDVCETCDGCEGALLRRRRSFNDVRRESALES